MTTYTFSPLDPNASPGPINDSDLIVGTFGTPGPGFTVGNAFIEQGDTRTVINQPGWSTANAFGINDAGQVVGQFYTQNNGQTGGAASGFLYNANGTVTTTFDPSATPDGPNNGETVASGINESGQIVGWYSVGNTEDGFLYDSRTGTYTTIDDPQTNHNAQLLAINDSGQIIDNYYNLDGSFHCGFYNGSSWSTIFDPSGMRTIVSGINDAGLIVGADVDSSGLDHGFIYDSKSNSYTTFDYPGAVQTSLAGINNDGQSSAIRGTSSVAEVWVERS
jgi:hypothetical protein